MLIHFRCPHCEKLLAIGSHKGGAQINCPMCTHPVTVPPRTEVEVPATTVVVLPDLSAEWWLDAPDVEAKSAPSTAPDAWWLTAEPQPPDAKSTNNQSPTG